MFRVLLAALLLSAPALGQHVITLSGQNSGTSATFTGIETADPSGNLSISGTVSINGGKGVPVSGDAIWAQTPAGCWHGYAFDWTTKGSDGTSTAHQLILWVCHPTQGTWGLYGGAGPSVSLH